jgi:hypothetical protein
MDMVGYSKLLMEDQRELLRHVNAIVRRTKQFRAAECWPRGPQSAVIPASSKFSPKLGISAVLGGDCRLAQLRGVWEKSAGWNHGIFLAS